MFWLGRVADIPRMESPELPTPSPGLILGGVIIMALLKFAPKKLRRRWLEGIEWAFDRLEQARPVRDAEGHAQAMAALRQTRAWWALIRPVVEDLAQ